MKITDRKGGSADDSSGGGLLENAIESIADFFTGGNDSSTRSVSDYTMSGISPRGTTINLFDYWISGQFDSDQSNPENWQNMGINSGHVLKFGAGMGTLEDADIVNRNAVNYWTGSAEPRQGIAADTLGTDGYPVLSGAGQGNNSIGTESLSYLFNSQNSDGKRAYMNVDGLLQVEDGYYVYNSQENFAEYDESSNSFILYNRGGVDAGGSSPDGQLSFTFGNISFEQAGTYYYTISEKAGDDETITYDDTVYSVKVTVTDNGTGQLSAEVEYPDGTPAFENTYTAPEEPETPEELTTPEKSFII